MKIDERISVDPPFRFDAILGPLMSLRFERGGFEKVGETIARPTAH